MTTYDEKNALNLSLFAESLSIHTIDHNVLNKTSSPARIPALKAIINTHITLTTIVIRAEIPSCCLVSNVIVNLTALKYSEHDIDPTRSLVNVLDNFWNVTYIKSLLLIKARTTDTLTQICIGSASGSPSVSVTYVVKISLKAITTTNTLATDVVARTAADISFVVNSSISLSKSLMIWFEIKLTPSLTTSGTEPKNIFFVIQFISIPYS